MSAIRSQLNHVVAAAITITASLAVLVIAPNATAWARSSAGMPPRNIIYFGDDGTDTLLLKFVAVEPGDLSAGTPYAARATQNEGQGFGLECIDLGKGNGADIAVVIAALHSPE